MIAADARVIDLEIRWAVSDDSGERDLSGVLIAGTSIPCQSPSIFGKRRPSRHVAESASVGIEPAISTNDDGQSVLTWTFENVQPNEELQVLSFKAQISDDAQPGSTHVNKVTATSLGITREASAEFVISNSGYTTLVKETDNQRVLLEDGKAINAWTLTLESKDPNTSAWTDVIDILPYNGMSAAPSSPVP